jgi:integrase
MRALMGLIKDRHGTYHAQQKVPEHLQGPVADVLGKGKLRQKHLKKSLGTKDLKTANVRAKPVQMEFDRIMRAAQALGDAKPPTRDSLSPIEIERMAEYVYARELEWDERFRVGGRDELKRTADALRKELKKEGRELEAPAYRYEELPPHGLSKAQLITNREELEDALSAMRDALALGDISAVEDQTALALDAFGINLSPGSLSYPKLAIAVLRAYVRALQDIGKRNAGEPVATPVLSIGVQSMQQHESATLHEAIEGWEKEKTRPSGTVSEYKRAVEMFIQLHGDLPVVMIKKSHARQFREALQNVPRTRAGKLKDATLPELVTWSHKHPSAPKVSPGTINKQLGALQAIVGWANDNGMIADDVPWSDPFHKMRVDEERSDRAPFTPAELQDIFDAPLFTKHEWPIGAKGAAGVWLPLLALFTGARQAEIVGLRVSNVQEDAATGTPLLFIVAELEAGKGVKTLSSERVIPVHPQLVKLGFLKYVAERRREGENAWLFPTVAPDQKGGQAAWGKWFGRYLRSTVGIADTNKVFHSFRHGFKDAARAAGVALEVHDALTGHSSASAVSAGYGAKSMLQRFGATQLANALASISYPGLDLSKVKTGYEQRSRKRKASKSSK